MWFTQFKVKIHATISRCKCWWLVLIKVLNEKADSLEGTGLKAEIQESVASFFSK